MSDPETNPYASPRAAEINVVSNRSQWRPVAAAVTFCLGLLSAAFGVFAVGVMFYVVFQQQSLDHIGDMLAGCFLYLGFGVCWIVAGIYFWRRASRVALCATIIGVLIPIVLFAIKGF